MTREEYRQQRNHIMAKLPDGLILRCDEVTRLMGTSEPPLKRPSLNILYRQYPFVDVRITDHKIKQIISTRDQIYLEYDTIASWIIESYGFIDLSSYHWYWSKLNPEPEVKTSHTNAQILRRTSPAKLSEQDVETALCEELSRHYIAYRRQFRCSVGIADVVTSTTIYEVKKKLSRSTLFQAIGQLYTYRSAINPSAKLVICFAEIETSDGGNLHVICESAGVSLKQIIVR